MGLYTHSPKEEANQKVYIHFLFCIIFVLIIVIWKEIFQIVKIYICAESDSTLNSDRIDILSILQFTNTSY